MLLQALTLVVSGPETSLEYLSLHVAQAFGDFAEEGLTVELRVAGDAGRAARALAEPGAVLAATTLDAAIRSGSTPEGRPPRLVFGLTAAPASALLVRAQDADRLRSIDDLAGLRVGVSTPGSPDHAWLLALLARSRLEVHEVRIESVGARRLAPALEAGQLMAALVPQPTASALVAQGRAAVLADLRTPARAAAALGVRTVNAGVFAGAGSQAGEAELRAVARALLRAQARITGTPAGTLAARLPPRVTGADFSERLEASRELYLGDGLVTTKAVETTVKLLAARTPFAPKLVLPPPEGLLHLDPLRQALRSREQPTGPGSSVPRSLSSPPR